jgi:predicted ATPase/class 3 adenylate cyclase
MAQTAPLPTGTVTLLFTDIEGSTQRWEQQRAAMAEALRRHDALMRTAIETHGGRVFKTIGDQFCAAFSRASAAIAAATDAQRAIVSEDWNAVGGLAVRMALHTGATDERDGDYFGPAVNRVARLLAVAHGGQVVVSGATADALRCAMPKHIELRDLGVHRLKDLAEPEHVWQLVAPALPDTFPALASLGSRPNNLPRLFTSFVGREQEVADIAALLKAPGFVTLVGAGGVGKTRCALAVAAIALDEFADGVWFVDLAPLPDPALVASAIAQALNLPLSPTREPLDIVLGYLKRKQLLLVLDNCEHVIEIARSVAAAILQNAPEVHLLATSREGLAIAGEEAYRLPSLAVPAEVKSATASAVSSYGAVDLFADRAFSADKRFVLTDENAPDVSEICRRLDGIPLAIELAAARVKVLSPRQLAQKLDERFRVLTGGDRAALPRHQTMRALIDWSYDLLSEDEQTVFRKLSIFAGGCTIQTATTVCGDGDELAMLERLSSLVEKSLLQAEPSDGGTRYAFLESTRQYARERLVERSEETAVARAHASALLTLADEVEALAETTPDRTWDAQVAPELENWRAAVASALGTRGDVSIGRWLAAALRRVWDRFAPAEGRQWIRLAAQTVDAGTDEAVVAALELAEATLDTALNQYQATFAAAERALTLYRRLGDERGVVRAQRLAGGMLIFLGRVADSESLLQTALAAAKVLAMQRTVGGILRDLAVARHFSGDAEGARSRYAEALVFAQDAGFERLAADIAGNRAEAEFRSGDAPTALRLAGEGLAIDRTLHDTQLIAADLLNNAAYLIALGRYGEARTAAREALTLARDLQYEVYVVFALQHLAAFAGLRPCEDDARALGERARAARLLGYADARLAALQAAREYTEQQEYDKLLPALRNGLGDDELAKFMTEGSTWSEDRAVNEAMLV